MLGHFSHSELELLDLSIYRFFILIYICLLRNETLHYLQEKETLHAAQNPHTYFAHYAVYTYWRLRNNFKGHFNFSDWKCEVGNHT